MDDKNDFKLWAQALRSKNSSKQGWRKWLGSRAQGIRCNAQIRVVVYMNDFRLWVEHSRHYEQLKVVDDVNESKLWA